MNHDPIRLLDDVTASAGLRRDLAAAARHRAPYDVSAGAARFEASLAKGAGAASSGWGGAALGVGALILGGLIGAGVWLSSPAAPVEDPRPAGVEAVVLHEPPAPREDVLESMPAGTGIPAPVVATAPRGPAEVPEEVGADALEAPAEKPTAGAKKVRSRRPAVDAARQDRGAAGGPSSADYLREARSLQAARGYLGRDPAEALARAEAGAAEFKAGAFAQEWEGVAILALFALDRRSEAERRATAYLARFPKGPYAGQVRDALERP